MADPEEPEEPEEEPAPRKNWRRDLEDRLEAAEARAQTAEQRAAIAEAGFSHLSEKQRKALSVTHDGEWTPEAIKATAEEVFGKQPVGQSTPASEQPEDQGDPTARSEASELNTLSQSPAEHEPDENAPIRSQAAFDAKVREFMENDDEAGFNEWMKDTGIHLIPFGSTAPQ